MRMRRRPEILQIFWMLTTMRLPDGRLSRRLTAAERGRTMPRNTRSRFLNLIDNKVRGLIILGIVLVVFNVLVFAIPFGRGGATFWIAYGFSTVAIIAQAGVCVVAFGRADTLRSKVLGFPIVEVGFVYVLAQLVLCLLLMTAGSFVALPVAVSLVPCILLMAAAAVLILVVDAAREEIDRQDVSVRANTALMRMLGADVQALLPRALDDASKIALAKLADELRYSDPVHVDGLEGIEAEMGQAFAAVKAQVLSGTDASAAVAELSALLNERNLKCQVLKQQAL